MSTPVIQDTFEITSTIKSYIYFKPVPKFRDYEDLTIAVNYWKIRKLLDMSISAWSLSISLKISKDYCLYFLKF